MTIVQVRVDPSESDDSDAELVLDLYGPRVRGANVQWDSGHAQLLKGLTPGTVALDFLRLGMAAYCVDKLVLRQSSSDAWTRDVELRLPVWNAEAFQQQRTTLEEAMSFLSGDRWTLRFSDHPGEAPASVAPLLTGDVEAVSLFSGGLDSLAGAIDQLVNGQRIVLVSHYDAGITPKRQKALADALVEHFPGQVGALRRLVLRPQARPSGLHHPLPEGDHEPTTRARSLLFVAAGIAVADALGDELPLVVPENGFIGINVPLTWARQGSLSTRTTHPHFFELLERALAGVGLRHAIRNPYRLSTKGELLAASRDLPLLWRLAPDSLSCSHPEAPRHRTRREGNCGYCWPCLIRRASMHHVGWDDGDQYIYDALTDIELLLPDRASGNDLRAAVASLHDRATPFSVLRNGPVPAHEIDGFFDVYRRGRAELSAWLDAGAGPALRTRLP